MVALVAFCLVPLRPPPSCVLPFSPLQVRWYSFQFVMDELVEELEEAYLSVSIVLDQLPYPLDLLDLTDLQHPRSHAFSDRTA